LTSKRENISHFLVLHFLFTRLLINSFTLLLKRAHQFRQALILLFIINTTHSLTD